MRKKKVYFITIFILLIILGIAFYPTIRMLYFGYKTRKELYKVHSVVDINDETFKGLSLIDSDLENNNIFFSGEKHGTVKSSEMYLYLLKYFVEKAGVKYIIYENGYATSQYINMYLESGDEKFLEYIMSTWSGTFSYTMENYEMLKKIYEYNSNLPEEKKVKFIGIDLENPRVAIKYINHLTQGKKSNNEKVVEFVNSARAISFNNYINDSKETIKLLEENEEVIEEYFKEDFFHISQTIKNLSVSKNQYFREKILINNFITLYEELPKGKYFGQFGGYHTNLGQNYESLASHLNHNYEETKNKVISIELDYNNSYHYVPSGLSVSDNEIYPSTSSFFFPGNKETTLFKLNPNNPQRDYSQYLILISDSESSNNYYKND